MNKRLVAGLTLLVALVCLSILAPVLAPFDFEYSESIRKEEQGGGWVAIFAPEAPNRRHPLGTDSYGYDMATNLLHGLPWTIAIVFGVALFRSILGFAIGVVTALGGGATATARGFAPLAALPSFIVAYFILYPFTIHPLFSSFGLLLFQCLVIGLLELPPVTQSFAARGRAIATMPFVDAARASGASRLWIARRHVGPFMFDDFLECIPVQAIAAASFVAKLGFFSLFIGGTTLQVDPLILRSTKQELIGLLGHYSGTFPERFWLFLGPFGGWLLVFACSELLTAGLRARTEKKLHLAASGQP